MELKKGKEKFLKAKETRQENMLKYLKIGIQKRDKKLKIKVICTEQNLL